MASLLRLAYRLKQNLLIPQNLQRRNAHTTGLYGFHHLKTPSGFQRFVDDAIQRSQELIEYISGRPSSAEVIKAMDEISNTVCCVVDSAELCRNTHPDREYVDAANKASMRINEYLHCLNTNHTLYEAVKKAEQDGILLTEEAQRAAHYLRVDFEKGGIHLPAGKLDRVNQLNMSIAQLSRMLCGCFSCITRSKHLHRLLKPIDRLVSGNSMELVGSRGNKKQKGFRITTEPHTLSSVLQWVPDEEVRKMAYIQGNSVPHANLGVLNELIAARHELAEIMGHKSYSEFAMKQTMASSSEVVMSFLHEMSAIVKPKADEELKMIQEFKRRKCGQKCGDLEPWDEAYYTAIMKSSAYNLDSSGVSSYFSVPQCIEGLKVLVESLFGATFRSLPLVPGESWHPDVIKMAIHHPEEGDLGYLYLDLYSREGKYPGCAHFAIRGGREISETDYQLPIVALVCNFPNSHKASVARLNHWELETLFHEFGHALHSLLSRTEYQHFSGTRVALDFAETPSNLLEYYAWDYRVLKKFAKHYATGEVIPEKLVKSMQGARKMFAATEMQRQIFYALIDQTLFGEQEVSPRDTSVIVGDLKRQYTSWKHVDGTHWQARFSHLVNYGAGYYSYLYAKCFAATIWERMCQENPLGLSTGTALRTKFLQHGGARDPSDLLNDLVGNGVLRYHNGGIVPDISSLCDEMKLVEDNYKQIVI